MLERSSRHLLRMAKPYCMRTCYVRLLLICGLILNSLFSCVRRFQLSAEALIELFHGNAGQVAWFCLAAVAKEVVWGTKLKKLRKDTCFIDLQNLFVVKVLDNSVPRLVLDSSLLEVLQYQEDCYIHVFKYLQTMHILISCHLCHLYPSIYVNPATNC